MIQERILLLMKSRGLTPTQFADEINIQRSSISHIISGRNNPSLDIITKILNRFPDVDSNWLILGKGSLVNNSLKIEKEAMEENTLFQFQDEKDIPNKTEDKLPDVIHNEVKKMFDLTNKQSNVEQIEKKIDKIVVFYSDNTYEEFIKA